MNHLVASMNAVKGRLWMAMVGGTIMDGESISWDDTSKKTIRNEHIRTRIFPFVSFSQFYTDGYQMLKQYYIDLPLGQTFSFIRYLMKLWTLEQMEDLRNCYRLAQDPELQAKVKDMSEREYDRFKEDYFHKNHKSIAKTREGFRAYSKMSPEKYREKLRKTRRQARSRIRELKRPFHIGVRAKFWVFLKIHLIKGLLASPLIVALIAVSLAELVKLTVQKIFFSS